MASTDPTGYLSIPTDLIRGVSWKQPARMASTGNLTLSGLQTVDGVVGADGNRVLVKDNTTGSQNGLWIMHSGAWVRAFDMDQDLTTAVPAEEVMGAIVYVVEGTANGGTMWRTTNTTAPTIGTTTITWAAYTPGSSGVTGFATPAVVLGTAAAAGAATTVIRSDSTIVAFDATAPVTQALGDVAATGSQAVAARRDHKHGMPALSTATPLAAGTAAVGTALPSSREDHVHPVSSSFHQLLISSSPSNPIVFADVILTSDGTDFLYSS